MSPLARTLLACSLNMAIAAMAQDGGVPPPGSTSAEAGKDGGTPWVVESCVSPDRIVLQRSDPWVALNETERAGVFEQMMRRYPVLQQDGLMPAQIVLWRPPGKGWLYVTMLSNPRKPEQSCFTATVTAQALDITGTLLQKYFALRSAAAYFASYDG